MKNRTLALCLAAAAAISGCRRNDEHCRQARAELNDLLSGLVHSMGTPTGDGPREIPVEPFMSQCRALPPEAAHCAVLSWGMAHPSECAPYHDAIRALRPR